MNPFSKVRQYPCLNEIYLNRSVSIYHAFLSLIVNNHAENVVRASCNARVKIRVSFVTSTRTISNERKKEEGGEEKGGETLTTTRPRSWLEWHFRESALPVEFYFFPPSLSSSPPCSRCYHILYRKFQKDKLPLLYRDTSPHCSVYSNRAYSNSLSLLASLSTVFYLFNVFFFFFSFFLLPRLSHLPFPSPLTT